MRQFGMMTHRRADTRIKCEGYKKSEQELDNGSNFFPLPLSRSLSLSLSLSLACFLLLFLPRRQSCTKNVAFTVLQLDYITEASSGEKGRERERERKA